MKVPNKRELQQIASNHSSDIELQNFMKIYKGYTKESFSFLMDDTTFHQIIQYDIEETCHEMTITQETKTIDNKIEQNKAQYNLDRQHAKISVLSSGNVSKYEF